MPIKDKSIYVMPEISIIMPLYNAERFLRESLISVFNQTFDDFELICIDDASTDTTLNIIHEYQQKDERIKVLVNQKRSGAACSRNRGIMEAAGKYLIFLDGDDIFDRHMLEESYNVAESKNADVAVFEYKHVPSEHIYEKAVKLHGKEYIKKYCTDVFRVEAIKSFELSIMPSSPCNKLIKRQFIISNQIAFQSLSSSNDVCFIYLAYILADRIIFLNDCRIFLYARDHQVTTRISYSRNPMCVYQAMAELQKELLRRNIFSRYFQHFYCLCYWSFLTALEKTKETEQEKAFYIFLQSEGIQKLYLRERNYYNKIDKDIKKRLTAFETCEFETGWFRKDDIFDLYLEKNIEHIRNLFSDCRKQKQAIAVWGAGRNGRKFLNYCSLHGFQVDAVIDANPLKKGETVSGFDIKLPETVLDNVQVIISIPQFIKKDIYKCTGNRNIKVVDINEFLCLV